MHERGPSLRVTGVEGLGGGIEEVADEGEGAAREKGGKGREGREREGWGEWRWSSITKDGVAGHTWVRRAGRMEKGRKGGRGEGGEGARTYRAAA
jgi:hypothetical protein